MTDQQAIAARLAEDAIRQAEQRANDYYSLSLPPAKIDYTLRGRCAGQAQVLRNGDTFLRINLQLLIDNLEDYLQQTISHEIAHLVVNWQHRKKRQRPRPHGKEWQAIMQDCFDLEPRRCHDYKTTPARIVPRNHLYRCKCREHRLTRIMHNKIVRSSHVLCKACRTRLQFVGKPGD